MSNILITGGAGFIGINAAKYFLDKNWQVTIFDNLSRKGTDQNCAWLQKQGKFQFIKGDVRLTQDIATCFANQQYDIILHLAAQVAVTTSVVNPREDFDINALGTFNMLEAVRQFNPSAFFIYASTNKVYGGMEEIEIINLNNRYQYKDFPLGISENAQLDFHSPYGCSKGCADQYVIDYSRIYGLKTVSFRQSCIYGTHQFGVEDQGWVAWFTIAALNQTPISIYGDGMQIRDVLYVDDLIRAYELAYMHRDKVSGQAYNIGGGARNTLSLLELIDLLNENLDQPIRYSFSNWRPGDQKVFVADIKKAQRDLGWVPKTAIKEGLLELCAWVSENGVKALT